MPPRNEISALEDRIARQAAELNLRCTQVADLFNVQQRQANELQTACEEINRLSKTVAMLAEAAEQREADLTSTVESFLLSENEKADLRVQLDKALAEVREVSQRLLTIETAYNDRELAIASTLETVNLLNAELVAASEERFKSVAAAQGESLRHRCEINEQKSFFQDKIKKIEAVVTCRDLRVRELEALRNRLSERVDFLEALRKSEQEAAEFKIRELTEELQRERQRHSAADEASAAMHREITSLLPKLTARTNPPLEATASMPQDNAA